MPAKPGSWRIEARKLRGKMRQLDIALLLGVHRKTVQRFFESDIGENEIVIAGGNTTWPDSAFTRPHVYRTPRKLDMGPIVAAARAALEARG